MSHEKLAFGKIGRLITKRKYAVIAVWLLILAIVLPIVLTATGLSSLTMETSSSDDVESAIVEDIIVAQFQKSVSNDSLVLVISTDNASSIATQRFIDNLVKGINCSSSISGIENITSVYSVLIPALNQTNEGVYLAYEGGNLTYTLLYSVPAIYSKVWDAAYEEALDGNLIPGLRQTNQGVYAVFDNANLTYNLLFGVPKVYSTVWSTAYNQTRDFLVDSINQTHQGVYSTIANANLTYNLLYSIPVIYLQAWQAEMAQTANDVALSNEMANQTTANILFAADPFAYEQYTSQLLGVFHATWVQSFIDLPALTPIERVTAASTQTNQQYINTFLAGNETAQAFATAVTDNFTLQDYMTNTQEQNNVELSEFAVQFVTDAFGGATSIEFVGAVCNLGVNPSEADFVALADQMIWDPATYNVGTDFVTSLNSVASDQSVALLSQDAESYAQYTGPLLNAFNTTWLALQNSILGAFDPFERASMVADLTNEQFINTAFASNATAKAFATALIESFSFNDYLMNSQEQNNEQLVDFSINYLSNSAGASVAFVRAAYNLGPSPSEVSLRFLANRIIWYPTTYGMSENFISLFNEVSYEQTEEILKKADRESFNDYTSHLLDYFDDAWCLRVPSVPVVNWINTVAAASANVANKQFIANYLSDSEEFSTLVASGLSLQDFLNANTTYTNSVIKDLAISYVSNSSGLSEELVSAVYDMGENATFGELEVLASNIVWDTDNYNVGEQLDSLITSFVSPTKDVTLISVTFHKSDDENLIAIRSIIASELAKSPQDIISVGVTGSVAISYDYMQSTFSDLELILPITLILLIAATAIFFRSIITPIITLGTIGIGIGVSQIFPYLVGTYINQVDYTVSTILLTVLIGVGTDYSIFILARHREERINSLPLFEAIKKSIVWAGESIVTSGATVIISFFALAFASMVFLQTMGLIVGLGVIVTLLASLTFAPALAAVLGDRIFWPTSGERFEKYACSIRERNKRREGYFARSGAFAVKHGKVIILISILVTVPAFYVYSTTVPNYNLLGAASDSLESVCASNVMTDSFGSGRLMPSYVVLTFSQPIVDDNGRFNMGEMATVHSVSSMLADYGCIQEVTGPTMPYGEEIDYGVISNDSDSTTYNSMLSFIGDDNRSVLITVRFSIDPYSTEAINRAQEIRGILHSDYADVANVTGAYLGGTTGNILDTKVTFESQFNAILPIVALGVGVVLFIVLGSLILPVFAILSVLMSIVWTLAATILVFQSAFSYGLLFITPLILFVLLLGIGMDYNIFILTRIREEAAKGQNLKDAIVNAIQQTGGIITAAAIILAGSLGSLMLSTNMMLKEMGFAFAFSILIDALVVRTYLVPAVMATFGKWNWYNPIKRLRRMPDTKENTVENEVVIDQVKDA